MTKLLNGRVVSLLLLLGLAACGSESGESPDGSSAKGGDASQDLASPDVASGPDGALVDGTLAGDAGPDGGAVPPDAGAGDASDGASVPDGGDAGGSDAAGATDGGVANVELQSGTQVAGDRPASNGSTAAPQVARLILSTATAGQPLSGSLDFQDPQNDAAELIVQVSGAGVHHVWTLSTAELDAKRIDLAKIVLGGGFSNGSYHIYLAVRDKAGNVSAYLVGSLVVGTQSAIQVCSQNEPFQLMGKIPSYSTAFYYQKNGDLPGYRTGSVNGGGLTIIGQTRAFIDVGNCSKLLLSGDSTGTKPLGWDNCLLVEYRATPGAAVSKRWVYCSFDNPSIFYMPTGEKVVQPQNATVGGSTLDPAVPNGSPFGHAAKAIDLLSQVPAGAKSFELTLHVLDYGSVGSTTEIWALPQ